MRSAVNRALCVLLLAPLACTAAESVIILGEEPGAWPAILRPLGVRVQEATHIPPAALVQHLESGALAVLTGASEYADALNIRATAKRIGIRSIVDKRNPQLQVVWEKQLDMPVFEVPPEAEIFAYERWTGAPVLVGIRRGKGAALWLAAPTGEKGYERYPYIPQALRDLGLALPFRSNRLWAFFDGAYRARVDLDYFAEQWRRAGISALHVAAWHYMDPDDDRDARVRELIKACHRRAIHVYAWLELPHVSEAFWHRNPQCREKTALLQDAQLDWRKLINLEDQDCYKSVSKQVHALLERFEWDGVNLAELYYESLEGMANPARFTPMNDVIRREYKQRAGIDPLELFTSNTAASGFLSFRAELAHRMQERWLAEIDAMRTTRPHLDVVLTHIDDRFDTNMRDSLGADTSRVLPLLGKYDFTFLIEDPATVWHLGPARYTEIAKRYAPLTPRRDKLAIDINIVERYQDVYPTKQQTGTELFQLVNVAAAAFPRVALYFEKSILKPDWDLLSSAAAAVKRHERVGPKLVVESPRGVGVKWKGPALVDGRAWPLSDGETIWLTPGAHVIETGGHVVTRITYFNGDVTSARVLPDGAEIAYRSSARAFAVLSNKPRSVEVDGEPVQPELIDGNVLVLPRGQHIVMLR